VLTSSFCHIPRIGRRTEKRLWSQGYRSWQSVLDEDAPSLFAVGRMGRLEKHLRESQDELDGGNATFFANRMPAGEHWRLFPEFQHSVAYLDIESTGLVNGGNVITTIALYNGSDIRYYVRGRNLEHFRHDIGRYRLIVTYNGKCFDVPFIEDAFGLRIDAAHIDLRFVLNSLGYKGGLKGCEKQLGIDRGDLDGVDGYYAVLLWRDYVQNQNERALETLLAYNIEDVVNLESLMVQAYNMKLRATPFYPSHRREVPTPPSLPFEPDRETILRIKYSYALG
jgi:uncharacterized protein YprB with RNaseH-like and TPR domain